MGALENVGERRREILQVHRLVRNEEELGQRKLPLAQDAKGGRHGFPLVALLDDRRRQRMVARLAVGPEIFARRNDEGKERREQLLEQVADEEALLTGLSHHGGWIDGVPPVGDLL